MAKRILIDGRFVGVGDSQTRYVLELVKGILALDHTNSYTLLLRPDGIKDAEKFLKLEIPFANWEENSESNAKYKSLKTKRPNLHLQILNIPHYTLSEQTKLLKYLNEKKFDLVHFTQFNHPVRYSGKYVITIQDLTLVGHLHRQNVIKRVAFNAVMKSAAKDSTKIIAISRTTMEDVISYYNVPKEKFDIIYHGVDHQNFNMNVSSRTNEIKKFKEKYNISEEYILYTGMWKRHKNILRMLKAFEQFRIQNTDNRIQLVLVGKVDKKEPEVTALINRINSSQAVILSSTLTVRLRSGQAEQGRSLRSKASSLRLEESDQGESKDLSCQPIVTTGFIDEEELPIAYAGAFVYCIPSLSEGFGWPPLEAMACGTPVISSRESCIPEILGKAPLYFDAYNVEDIAKKMKTITTDNTLRKELIKKGLEQVKKYNWEETAEKTYKVYKELLEGE